MNYSEYKIYRKKNVLRVEKLLADCNDDDLTSHQVTIKKTLLPEFTKSGFSNSLFAAFCLNTWTLRAVKRKAGGPYATHPTRMALDLVNLLGSNNIEAERSATLALLHDLLEEGPGLDPEAYCDLCKQHPSLKYALVGSVLLTEPDIKWQDTFGEDAKLLDYVAYARQVVVMNDKLEIEHYNAIVADKLDNIHEWDYVFQDPNLSEESTRDFKLSQKMAYYVFIRDIIKGKANSKLEHLLSSAITRYLGELPIKQNIYDEQYTLLFRLFEKYEQKMSKTILNHLQRFNLDY